MHPNLALNALNLSLAFQILQVHLSGLRMTDWGIVYNFKGEFAVGKTMTSQLHGTEGTDTQTVLGIRRDWKDLEVLKRRKRVVLFHGFFS